MECVALRTLVVDDNRADDSLVGGDALQRFLDFLRLLRNVGTLNRINAGVPQPNGQLEFCSVILHRYEPYSLQQWRSGIREGGLFTSCENFY